MKKRGGRDGEGEGEGGSEPVRGGTTRGGR